MQKVEECDIDQPLRSSKEAAGFDLQCSHDFAISPWSRLLVRTGVRFYLPKGVYARLAPRSGLSLSGVDIGAGVVDRDYRGEVKVLVINNSNSVLRISKKSRICQVILERIATPKSLLLGPNYAVPYMIDYSKRANSGFGLHSGLF